nr:hypothetical protein CFP56_52247 [Quercus suber]
MLRSQQCFTRGESEDFNLSARDISYARDVWHTAQTIIDRNKNERLTIRSGLLNETIRLIERVVGRAQVVAAWIDR